MGLLKGYSLLWSSGLVLRTLYHQESPSCCLTSILRTAVSASFPLSSSTQVESGWLSSSVCWSFGGLGTLFWLLSFFLTSLLWE